MAEHTQPAEPAQPAQSENKPEVLATAPESEKEAAQLPNGMTQRKASNLNPVIEQLVSCVPFVMLSFYSCMLTFPLTGGSSKSFKSQDHEVGEGQGNQKELERSPVGKG